MTRDIQTPAAVAIATAGFPQTGDIILFRDGKKNPAVIAQRAARLARGGVRDLGDIDIAHVAVTITSTSVVHSMPRKGVHFSLLTDFKAQAGRLIVLRQVHGPRINENILEAAVETFGFGYNPFFDLKKVPGLRGALAEHVFCSELLDRFYTRQDLEIPEAKAFIHPNDLKALMRSAAWRDVTDIYLPYLRGENAEWGEDVPLKMMRANIAMRRQAREIDATIKSLDRKIEAVNRQMSQASAAFSHMADSSAARDARRKK